MWLVLYERWDSSAPWACEGLRARGLTAVELVSADSLAGRLRWEHRIEPGGVTGELVLADGRTIAGEEVRGVVNRLVSVPTEHLATVPPADREYAAQELYALFLSWLHAFRCPVLNRPTRNGLSGPSLHRSEWTWLASKAGLPAAPYTQTSADPPDAIDARGPLVAPGSSVRVMLVVGGGVVGVPAPPEVVAGCRRLGELAGTALLGVHFAVDGMDAWSFVGASPLPDLVSGEEPLLDLLAATLTGEEGDAGGTGVRHSV